MHRSLQQHQTGNNNDAASQHGILFASVDKSVFVLDIPATIAAAQSTATCKWSKQLLSREALTAPLGSLEPKSSKAKQRLLARGQGVVDSSDEERRRLIKDALDLVKNMYDGELVLPRKVAGQKSNAVGDDGGDIVVVIDDLQEDVVVQTLSFLVASVQQSIISNRPQYTYSHNLIDWHPWTPSISNPTGQTLRLHIRNSSSSSPLSFHLPPSSSLLLHTLPPSSPALAPTPPTGFDLVLLDPPWPNKSVKRSSQYSGPRNIHDTRTLLSNLNLPAHLAEHSSSSSSSSTTIAIWTTNSAAVRDIVCNAQDGWLAELGFVVVEEWIWIKTTASGEPIYAIEGMWRKPYEVLLVAKPIVDPETSGTSQQIRRRVIVAVPDVHSRKPSLKYLFEELLMIGGSYNGLEVFARYLTAGWHAWGNEVLLHNWEGHWN